MKKIYIVAAITLMGFTFAQAEDSGSATGGTASQGSHVRPVSMMRYGRASTTTPATTTSGRRGGEKGGNTGQQGMPPGMMMGGEGMQYPMTDDAATNAKVKALVTEMEVKIKAIREDYAAQIKATIGTHTLVNGRGMMASGTIMMMRGDREDGSSTMMRRGSTTMMRVRQDDDQNENNQGNEGDVRGAPIDTQNAEHSKPQVPTQGEGFGSRVRSMFGGIFGR